VLNFSTPDAAPGISNAQVRKTSWTKIIVEEMSITGTVCIAAIKDSETAVSQYGTCDVVGVVENGKSLHKTSRRCCFDPSKVQAGRNTSFGSYDDGSSCRTAGNFHATYHWQ
jgi:hypothetical protein